MPFSAENIARFQHLLHAWYAEHHRKLPWRKNPGLYKTVVSEFMLQQTRVDTALPYFNRWMERLPDFAALAASSEMDILKLWEGLGYYSRARNLHRLARKLVELDAIPRTPASWEKLPGVGPYTAAAVTSITFGAPVPCVDGNVVRILARISGDGTPYKDNASAARAFVPLAERLLNAATPGLHNQAMMELGATFCTRRAPDCATCPVLPFCFAGKRGTAENFPRLQPKSTEKVHQARLWCLRKGRILLHRSPTGSRRLANLYELPTPEHLGMAAKESDDFGAVLATKTRTITRFRITETIHLPPENNALRTVWDNNSELEWIPVAGLDNITLSGPHRKWVTELLSNRKIDSEN